MRKGQYNLSDGAFVGVCATQSLTDSHDLANLQSQPVERRRIAIIPQNNKLSAGIPMPLRLS